VASGTRPLGCVPLSKDHAMAARPRPARCQNGRGAANGGGRRLARRKYRHDGPGGL